MGAVGYYVIRQRIVSEAILNALNDLIVYLFLPCLILYDFFDKFSFAAYGKWWIFPLLGVVVSLTGLVVGGAVSSLISSKEKRNQFLSLCAFQNSGYIPLLIVQSILKPQDAQEMYMYIFLFLVGFNFLIWSLGAKLISGEERSILSLKDFYNPPILATIVALVMIYFRMHHFIPLVVLDSLGSFGSCMMPLAILVVGGSLATIKLDERQYFKDVILAVGTKLFIFPALVLAGLVFFKVQSLLGLLLIIEAAVPSAVTLTVVAKYYHKDETFINQTIFYSHIVGLVTLPLFLILYQRMVG